ncbi:MAG: peptidase M4 family protein, partial [Streptomycetaceae bacterium]|nr:peptidase M4 family protein [Streptomycetaceae bacterium]
MRRHTAVFALACATTLSLAAPAAADETDPPPRVPDHAALLAQENGRIPAVAKALGAEAAEGWSVRDVVADKDGDRHVRIDRTSRGLPVIGGDQIVHLDARGGVTSVDRAGAKDITPDTTAPKLTAAQAVQRATAATGA